MNYVGFVVRNDVFLVCWKYCCLGLSEIPCQINLLFLQGIMNKFGVVKLLCNNESIYNHQYQISCHIIIRIIYIFPP
jgi:hypothetical protein